MRAASRSPSGHEGRPGREAAREGGRGAAVVRVEVGVAAAHGEPVRLAHDRPQHQLDVVQVQIAHQPPHDRRLLGVLLAEDRPVGAHREQQLRDHRGHPVEVAGPGGALQPRDGPATEIRVAKPGG